MDAEQGQNLSGDGVAAPISESPAADQISDDIRERVSSVPPKAAEGVEHAADAARQAAESLRDEEAWLARLVDQGADKLSALAQTLRSNDPQTLLTKTEQFARRQPALFTGAAIAVGFALARAAGAAARSAGEKPSSETANVDD